MDGPNLSFAVEMPVSQKLSLEADESVWVKQLLDIYVLYNDRYPSWLILTIVLKTLSCDLSGLDDLDRLLLQLRHRSAVQKPKCCSPAAV